MAARVEELDAAAVGENLDALGALPMSNNSRVSENGWLVAWVVVGGALAVGVISFAIGPLVLIPAAVGGALLMRRPAARRAAYGALIGIGVLLLYVAALNRKGPGVTCWQHGTTSGCDDQLNPLPWLALGLAFIVGGFVAHRLRRH